MQHLGQLAAVAAFLESVNKPTADWIRDEIVIVVKVDDLLSRLYAFLALSCSNSPSSYHQVH